MNMKQCNSQKSLRNGYRLWITFLFFCLTATGLVHAAGRTFAQTTVTANFKNAALKNVLWEIQRQTDFTFVYSTSDVKDVEVQSLRADNEKISTVLDKCLEGTGLTYTVNDGVVAIRKSAERSVKEASPQQKHTVSGVVLDETGEPLIGANVLVKGTANGQITDLNGHFSIETSSANVKLVVSYVGYTKQEVDATAGKAVKITMTPDSNLMEEVVVTGYGTFKKSAYAGSASNVKNEKIADIPTVSFQDMLQGNATGVQFQQASGQPGSGVAINIRGMGSFNAGNTPLYVIDGVPVISGNINSIGSDNGLDAMTTINTSDIENITVIKDAAAASLYGSRAANGVVLITTKGGKQGKASVSLKADWGWSDFATDFRETLNGDERRQFWYDGAYRRAIRDGESEEDAKAYAEKYQDRYAPIPWNGWADWRDAIYQKGSHSNYEASISGGTDKFKYYSSLGYMKQEGIVRTSGLERTTGRVNVEYQATKRLKAGANLMFTSMNQNVYSEGGTYTSPLYGIVAKVTPSDPIYNEDGTFNQALLDIKRRNPVLAQKYNYQREYVTRSFNTIFAEYEFIKDLKLKSIFSYDYTASKGKYWRDNRTSDGEKEGGKALNSFSEIRKMVWSNQLSYRTSILDDHHLDALLGYEVHSTYDDYLSGDAEGFLKPEKNDISNAATPTGVGGSHADDRMISYISRLNYDYKNKYFLGGSYRMDGSSRLHRDNRWGSFWSVSAAWRAIEESFMEPVTDWLTDLKLRASYGVNGTLPSDLYGYMGLTSVSSSYMGLPAMLMSRVENRDLEWETNYNFNLGLDFALFNRVNVTLEYYTRKTKNLLMNSPVSRTTGFSSFLSNVGEIQNKGIELEINSKNIETKNFSWNTTFTLSHNKNKVVKLDGEQEQMLVDHLIIRPGYTYGTFYMRQFAGINPETGDPQFYTNAKDENGNYVKEVTEDYGKANPIALDKHKEPNVIGALSNTLRYKWFDLSFMFSYQFGAFAYDGWASKTEHGGDEHYTNIPAYYRDSWKKPGDKTKYEVFILDPDTPMNGCTTDRRLHSTDFIRLKTLNFGFTLPKQWVRSAGMESVRLFASANNLWTWAAWDFYDPESVNGSGSADMLTPPLKSVTFGLNVKF